MKGFTKIVLILAGVSFLFGTAITVAAASLGGRMPRTAVINGGWHDGQWLFTSYESSGHRDHASLPADEIEQEFLEEYEYSDEQGLATWEEEAQYDIEEALDINAVISASGCSKIEVSVEAAGVEIVEGKRDGSLYVAEAGKYIEWEQKVDDDTLELTIRRKRGIKNISWEDGRAQAILVIPTGETFREIEINVGAGYVAADTVTTGKLDLEAGAGSIIINFGNVQELSIECAAGSVEYRGTVGRELEAECQAGNIEAYLSGDKDEFNYELEVSMGNIEIDGETYGSLNTKKHLTNEGAVKKAELECEVGNIEILFTGE